MFAVGADVVELTTASLDPEERRCIALLRSCFAASSLEKALLESLPDVDEIGPPLLPSGWEQRLDQSARKKMYLWWSQMPGRIQS